MMHIRIKIGSSSTGVLSTYIEKLPLKVAVCIVFGEASVSYECGNNDLYLETCISFFTTLESIVERHKSLSAVTHDAQCNQTWSNTKGHIDTYSNWGMYSSTLA